MDTLSHALLGGLTAQLGFRQRIGRDATWAAVGTALLPDLDTLVVPLMSLTSTEVDDLARITIHRGISHSLLLAPLVALPIAGLWWWLRRRWASDKGTPGARVGFGLLYLCVLTAAACHPLLDWCTSYGTQLFAPLTDHRFSLDAIPIIDVFLTPLLVVTLLTCFVVRKVTRGGSRATVAIGWVGLALFIGYIATGRVMRGAAISRALAVAGPVKVLRADAYPTIGSIFLWRAVIHTDDGWLVSRQQMLSDRPGGATFVPQESNEWVARAERLEAARTFRWFAQGRVRTAYARRDGLHIVELHDMRYGPSADSIESLWHLQVVFDEHDGGLVSTAMVAGYRGGRFFRSASRFWGEMWRR